MAIEKTVEGLVAEIEQLRTLLDRVARGEIRTLWGWDEAGGRHAYWGQINQDPAVGPFGTRVEAIEAAAKAAEGN